jgi:hypothetical protein
MRRIAWQDWTSAMRKVSDTDTRSTLEMGSQCASQTCDVPELRDRNFSLPVHPACHQVHQCQSSPLCQGLSDLTKMTHPCAAKYTYFPWTAMHPPFIPAVMSLLTHTHVTGAITPHSSDPPCMPPGPPELRCLLSVATPRCPPP